MLASLAAALFPDDGNWIWRRRMAVASTLAMLTGILHSTFVDYDLPHATMVMDACQQGLVFVLGLYIGGAVYDAHSRRKVEAQATAPQGSTS
jgi:hypothetical protein